MKFTDFAKRGIDVSTNNGTIDWTKFTVNFAIHRVGYGRTIDDKFLINWATSKGKCNRAAYWYMDYYSNWYLIPGSSFVSSARGLTDVEWGEEQADNCWAALKNDPESIIWLDVENGGSTYSPPLTNTEAKKHALIIAKSFLQRIDELNGKTNGIYTSVGWLSWFSSWFRGRPLWVAWYNEYVDVDDVILSCRNNGWLVDPVIWQYASYGDVDDNGTADGKSMGMQYDFLDLNGWVGTKEQYELLFSTIIDKPDDEVIPIPENTRVIPIKTTLYKMNMRSSPKIGWNVIKVLPIGMKLDCLETVKENNNTWQRVGIDQYIADTYNGIQYLK